MTNNTILSLCEAYKNYFAFGAAVNPRDLVGAWSERIFLLSKKNTNNEWSV